MTRLRVLAPFALMLLSNAPAKEDLRPRPAPAHFVSYAHGLTFRSPAGSTYCPFPAGWVGSDHGTVVFLTPPHRCGGAGYPSSSRSWDSPATHIDVYYAYWMGEDEPAPSPCRRVGSIRMFGKSRPLCRREDRNQIVIDATARFRGDLDSQMTLTLVTTPKRFAADLATFRAMATSIRGCRAVSRAVDDNGHKVGKPEALGVGAPCPRGGIFF